MQSTKAYDRKPDSDLRPPLKRQVTAPIPELSYSTKKLRGEEGGEQVMWSEDVHAAFLEALKNVPLGSTWRTGNIDKNCFEGENVTYSLINHFANGEIGPPRITENVERMINKQFDVCEKTPKPNLPDFSCHDETIFNPIHAQVPVLHDMNITADEATKCFDPNETPSITTRRRANNRPTINLHVEIPPFVNTSFSPFMLSGKENRTPGSGPSCSTPTSGVRRSLSQAYADQKLSNPVTPREQCSNGPPTLPEAPRITNVRRNQPGRWVPTPTEGVLPSLSYAVINSPAVVLEVDDCYPTDEESTAATRQCRPKMHPRSVSWLSYPKRSENLEGDSRLNNLASPFITPHPTTVTINPHHSNEQSHNAPH